MEQIEVSNSESDIRTIAVLTSGGDAPGMNAAIRAVTRAGIYFGMKVYGVHDGFKGLINGDFELLSRRNVSGILNLGGTFLRTARCDEIETPHGQREAVRQLNNEGIEALVIIGGDGSMAGGQALIEKGFEKVVGIPGTIDNDIFGTDSCVGVDTALNTIMEAVDKIRDTAASHSRAFLVQTMGRECGYLAVQSAMISGAEMALVPEDPVPVEEIARTIENSYKLGKKHCIIIIAEGYQVPMVELGQKLDKMDLGFTTRAINLSYIQRGGTPTSFDRILASRMGFKTIQLIREGSFGVMTALQGGKIIGLPIVDVIGKHRSISEEYLQISNILSR